MPPNLVRCAVCRALLNPDLKPRIIHAPDFAPLPELMAVVDTPLTGYYVPCPACQQVLRVHQQFSGKQVMCKHCSAPFLCRPNQDHSQPCSAVYVACPHCSKELRAAPRYIGERVACKFCGKGLRILQRS